MSYEPRVPAHLESVSDVLQWAVEELRQLSATLEAVENIQLVRIHVEPDKKNDGMVVLADGSDWDPGSGAGIYWWDADGAAWTFLG